MIERTIPVQNFLVGHGDTFCLTNAASSTGVERHERLDVSLAGSNYVDVIRIRALFSEPREPHRMRDYASLTQKGARI